MGLIFWSYCGQQYDKADVLESLKNCHISVLYLRLWEKELHPSSGDNVHLLPKSKLYYVTLCPGSQNGWSSGPLVFWSHNFSLFEAHSLIPTPGVGRYWKKMKEKLQADFRRRKKQRQKNWKLSRSSIICSSGNRFLTNCCDKEIVSNKHVHVFYRESFWWQTFC